jgi:WD40 repeat protein
MVQYDAFISYSHSADGTLSPALQNGLQRLAKPWGRRRALEVFRDETGLSASPHLWGSIVEGLDNARFIVHLASTEAADSEWVGKELEHWHASHPGGANIVLVLTDGVMEWDEATHDFSANSTAVNPKLRNVFADEPLYVDLTWAKGTADLDLANGRFSQAVAHIAAPIRGVHPDELISEDIRQFKKAKKIRRAAMAGLATLTVAAVVASVVAVQQRGEAQRQRSDAVSQRNEATTQRNEAVKQKQAAIAAQQLAEKNAAESRSRELAAIALNSAAENPVMASLLAVEADYPNGSTTATGTVEAKNAIGVTLRALEGADALQVGPVISTNATQILKATSDRIATTDGNTADARGHIVAPLWWDAGTGARVAVKLSARQLQDLVLPFGLTHSAGSGAFTVDALRGRIKFGGPLADEPAKDRLVGTDVTTGDLVAESFGTGRVLSTTHLVGRPEVSQVVLLPSGEMLALGADGQVRRGVFGRSGDATLLPLGAKVHAIAAMGPHRLLVEFGDPYDALRSAVQHPRVSVFDLTDSTSPRKLASLDSTLVSDPGTLTVSPDGNHVAAIDGSGNIGSASWPLGVWDLRTGRRVASVETFGATSVKWMTATRFATASQRGVVQYELRHPAVLGVPIGDLSLDASGGRMVLWSTAGHAGHAEFVNGSLDAQARLGEPLNARQSTAPPDAVVMSPDGAEAAVVVAASNGASKSVVVLSTATHQRIATIRGASSATFDPTTSRLAVGAYNSLRIVDTTTWKPRSVPLATGFTPVNLTWSPDGSSIEASACRDCPPPGQGFVDAPTIDEIVVDVASGATTKLVDGSYTSSVAWSPDGQAVAVGGNGEITLYERRSGEPGFVERVSWAAGTDPVSGLAFSADGLRLVSVAEHLSVMWNLADPSHPRSLQVLSDVPILRRHDVAPTPDGPPNATGIWSVVRFRANGRSFVIAGSSGAVDMPDDDPALACREATPADLAAVAKVIGGPSACTRVPELMAKG